MQQFAERLGRLRFHRIAARPPKPVQMENATLLAHLFPNWVEESKQFIVNPKVIASLRETTDREFDFFLERSLPQIASGNK